MNEMPADILVAAEKALDNLLCNCREAGDVRQDSIRDIAVAILAEREATERRVRASVRLNMAYRAFFADW